MSLDELLALLQQRTIRLSAAQGKLQVQAPPGAVDQEVRAALAAHKSALLSLLAGGQNLDGVLQEEISGPVPQTANQQGLYLQHCLDAASSAYHMPLVLEFGPGLHVAALREAIADLVRRHASLRTRFFSTEEAGGKSYWQQAVAGASVCLGVSQCESEPAVLQARIADLLAQAFDLQAGEVFHADLLLCGEGPTQWAHLVCVLHHIAADGWSAEILKADLAALYSQRVRGAGELPQVNAHFAAFARYLHQQRQDYAQQDQAFWQQYLHDLPEQTELGLCADDGTGTPGALAPDLCLEYDLPQTLLQQLQDFARARGVTLYPVFLAALGNVLSRFCYAPELVITCPQANRSLPGSQQVAGLFLDNMPLRVAFAGVADFARRCQELEAALRECGRHTRLTLAEILSCGEWQGGADLHPLQQVSLNLLDFPRQDAQFAGVEVKPHADILLQAKYALTLYLLPSPTGWRMRYHAKGRRFDAAGIALLQQALLALLEQVCAQNAASAAAPSVERRREQTLLHIAQQMDDGRTQDSVPALFRAQVARQPQATAILWQDQSMSYGELARAVDAVHAALHARQVDAGNQILILARRNQYLPIAMLAALQAGCAYAILDLDTPLPRLRAALALLRPACCLSVDLVEPGLLQELADWMGGAALQTVHVPHALQHAVPADLPRPVIAADDIACLTFTSGSSGQARIVQGRHGALCFHLPHLQSTYQLGAGERYALLGGLMSDPLQRDLFTPLCTGGSVAIPGAEDMQAQHLAAWVAAQQVSVLNLTPAMARYLCFESGNNDSRRNNHTLRWLFLCGDMLRWAEVHDLHRLAPAAGIVNLYGMTESQRALSEYLCLAPGADARQMPLQGQVPIGDAGANTRLVVCNVAGEIAADGECGDIFLLSQQLAHAYLGAEQDSAARFLPLPGETVGRPGLRLLRTGDRGRYRAGGRPGAGHISFLGRQEQQVNIRGHRFALAEVEQAALASGLAQQVKLLLQNDGPGGPGGSDGPRLLLFWVAASQAAGQEAGQNVEHALLQHLRRHLPSFMQPARCLRLSAMPLNRAGKIDQAALLLQMQQEAPAAAEAGQDMDSFALAVAEVWQECLGHPVAADADFFAMGGHSLLALKLSERLYQAFGVRYLLQNLLQDPSLQACIADLRAQLGNAPVQEQVQEARLVPAIGAQNSVQEFSAAKGFPLTEVQQAYWVGRGAQFDLGGLATSTYIEYQTQDADPQRLQQVINILLERHPMLRCKVNPLGLQQILPLPLSYTLPVQDLRTHGAEPCAAALAAWRSEMEQHVFDSSRWPLFDVRLSLCADGRAILHLAVDLLITDFWSSRIILREFLHYYQSPQQALPVPQFPFIDYVLHLQQRKQEARYAQARQYWLQRLPHLPAAPALPQQAQANSLQPRFTRRDFVLSRARWQALGEQARALNLTRSVVLLTAYAQVLARWSEQAHFCLNLTFFDRPGIHPDIQNTVGDFTSLILLEMDMRHGSFLDKLKRVQRRLFADLEHSQFGAIEVMREWARQANDGMERMVPVVFTDTLNHDAGEEVELDAGLAFAEVYRNAKTSQVWIDHTTSRRDGQVVLHWNTLDHVFPPQMIEQMFAAYCELIAQLCDAPASWRQDLPIALPPQQLARRAQYRAWQQALPDLQPGLLHAGFLRQAAAQPQALAVIGSGQEWTYQQLHACAGAVSAQILQGAPARAEVIAVLLPKGVQQIAAILGVMLAGGCYLPLDPLWPAQRLEGILQQARVRQVLTTETMIAQQSWLAAFSCIALEPLLAGVEQGGFTFTPPPPRTPALDDPAYIIFTSGSTGTPKGVVMTHRATDLTLQAINRLFEVNPADRVFALSSICFDLSVYDIFGSLAAGAALVVPDAEEVSRPAGWEAMLRKHAVSVWNSVPALMQVHLDGLGAQTAVNSRLRLVLLSGDWIALNLPQQIKTYAHKAQVISLGGATEAAVWSIYYPIPEQNPEQNPEQIQKHQASSVPYGYPLPQQGIQVRNEQMQVCAEYVAGDIYIGGKGLAREYLGDAQRSRNSFVLDPDSGERLYRTGDLGRFLPSGVVELIGRRDTQVKLAGHRIELGEIDSHLLRLPDISAAQCVVRKEKNGAQFLLAVLAGAEFTQSAAAAAWQLLEPEAVAEWIAQLQRVLPAYMVPRDFVGLQQLPLTANGKLNRQQLLSVPLLRNQLEAGADSAPQGLYEEKLAVLWQQLLEYPHAIGREDGFFMLGGNSLLAMRALNRVNLEFGVQIGVRELYQHASLRELAALIETCVLSKKLSQAGSLLQSAQQIEEGEI